MSLLQVFERQGYKRIANGCYGTVYGAPSSQWVVKHAANDGTRTYLEWCLWKGRRGERMQGMPEIDFLIDADKGGGCGGYIVSMKRYKDIRNRLGDWWDALWWSHGSLHKRQGCPGYVLELIEAFEADTGLSAYDTHSENIMFDDDLQELVVTDPSCDAYSPLGVRPYEDAPELLAHA